MNPQDDYFEGYALHDNGTVVFQASGKTIPMWDTGVAFSFRLKDTVKIDPYMPGDEVVGKEFFLHRHGRADRVLHKAKGRSWVPKILRPEVKMIVIPADALWDHHTAERLIPIMNRIVIMGRLLPGDEVEIQEAILAGVEMSNPFDAGQNEPSPKSEKTYEDSTPR